MENPLQSYYRTKELYVRLPTQGKWMKNPPILSEDGEIGVRAMSMKDELLLTIPDALYNGQAIFELIQSVCPDITDPTEVSLPDVDVILLASRASSYDKIFPVETTCPHCKKQAMHEIDLQIVLGKVTHIYEKTEVEIKLDKTVYNIGKDLTLKGSSVSDVLDNLPSLAVDIDGNISLRGNQNVRILINGKPSGLVGISSNDALKQFQAYDLNFFQKLNPLL